MHDANRGTIARHSPHAPHEKVFEQMIAALIMRVDAFEATMERARLATLSWRIVGWLARADDVLVIDAGMTGRLMALDRHFVVREKCSNNNILSGSRRAGRAPSGCLNLTRGTIIGACKSRSTFTHLKSIGETN